MKRRDGLWLRVGRWWYHPIHGRVPLIAGGSNIFALTQQRYQWYEDDTGLATPIAAENTAMTRLVAANSNFILIVQLQESGAGSVSGATTDDYRLQYSKNGGAFTNVTTATTNIRGNTSSPSTPTDDSANVNQRLTSGSGSWLAGRRDHTGEVTNFQVTANNFTEHLYCLTCVAADVAEGDVFTFRVLLNAATTNVTYSVTPTFTVTKISAPDYLKTMRRRPTRRNYMNALIKR